MPIRPLLLTLPLACAALAACSQRTATQTNPPETPEVPPAPDAVGEDAADAFAAAPFFQTYCYACHRGDNQEGDIDLSVLTAANIAEHTELWEETRFQVDSGAMPTGWGSPKPSGEERAAFVAWVDAQLEAIQPAD